MIEAKRGVSVKEKDKLMTAEEVCHYLKISLATLYRLIKRGLLPGFKVGQQWRFRRGQVDEYLEARRLSQPRFFKTKVLEHYRERPAKYEIREDREGGWLSLKESYLAKMPPSARRREFFQWVRYTWVKLKTGESILRVMPSSFGKFPQPEQVYWAYHEIY